MPALNLTNLTTAISPQDKAVVLNQLSGGIFGPIIVLGVVIFITLMFTPRWNFAVSFMAASWVGAVTAFLLDIAGLMARDYTIIAFVVAGLSVIGVVALK